MRRATVESSLTTFVSMHSSHATYTGCTMSTTPRSPLSETPTWILLLVLFNGLALLAFIGSLSADSALGVGATIVLFLAVVDVGLANRVALAQRSALWTNVWLLSISGLWILLAFLAPVGIYLVFPIYVLLVWSVGSRLALVWSLLLAICSVVTIAMEQAWSIPGVVGPVIGCLVAVGGAWAYKRLHTESTARGRMFDELQAAQSQLAVAQHEAGQMVERERLAQELHDTTSQSLTSIQMLLRAVEAADPQHPQIDKIELARKTAADGLAETRRVINDLTPTGLVSDTLAGALNRLAADATQRTGIHVTATSREENAPIALPIPVQATLLRVAQGAIGNVERHSHAKTSCIDLTTSDTEVCLRISDDGIGYSSGESTNGSQPSDGFGISTMQSRVKGIGGELSVTSPTWGGTLVTATIPLQS